MTAASDLPSAIAEIKATLYRNAVGAISAVKVQQLLIDIVNVLDTIAVQAATVATDVEVANLTPGLIGQASSAGTQAGRSVGAAAGVAAAAPYAMAALASENAAQAILNSYSDDGIQGLSVPGPPFDDGVQQ